PRLLKREQSSPLEPDQVKALRELCGAAEPEPCLTLAPVIGQRRSMPTEFRPDPKAQQAWTSTRTEEAREFGQFDRIRDDGWKSPSANKGKRSRGGGGPRPSRPRGKPGPVAGSQYVDPGLNPAVLRAWFPDSPQPGARKRKPGQRGPGGRPNPNANGNVEHGNRAPRGNPQRSGPVHGNRPPRDHARADDAVGNRAPRGNSINDDARGNRAQPQGGQRDQGGVWANRARPAGGEGRGNQARGKGPRGNNPQRGGNAGNTGNAGRRGNTPHPGNRRGPGGGKHE
ncbi:MAG: hypothetical protein KF811_05095, partial [Dokdonella sp.]|nr:hypothetical protein [Dokdonella sp.]